MAGSDLMQTIEVKNCSIKYITANVKSKIRDGEHSYVLTADDISRIINLYVKYVEFLTNTIKNKNKNEKKNNELYNRTIGQPDKTGGIGHGD